ncbi:MAG: VOC family protein [Carboxylicivirga sp.]|jgi:lactoylglutathione lyase|nr:VOC family protein [Carboxylicivirga sp.]
MQIEHIAIWVSDLEVARDFYIKYFQMQPNNKYENRQKQFTSYFMKHAKGVRLELMHHPDLGMSDAENKRVGFAHIAFSTGSKELVDSLTNQLRNDGYTIQGEPRMTGDGYYESIVLDPDGNWIEITE